MPSSRAFTMMLRKALGWNHNHGVSVRSKQMNWGEKLHTWPGMIGYTMKVRFQRTPSVSLACA